MSKKQSEIYDVLDEMLALPEDYQHLCSAYQEDGETKEGYLRFILNRDVIEMIQDIGDELESSRDLPVNAFDISISDNIVVKYLRADEHISPEEAIRKARGWYSRQKQQVRNDAIFIGLTYLNELNVAPTPYKEDEVAFAVQRTIESKGKARTLPAWMEKTKETKISDPVRDLNNPYESRLKQLYDMTQMLGATWVVKFLSVVQNGMAKTIRLLEPTDDAGFPSEPSSKKVSKKSSAANGNKGS